MTPDLYLAISFRAEKKRALQDGLRSITTTLKVCGTLSSSPSGAVYAHSCSQHPPSYDVRACVRCRVLATGSEVQCTAAWQLGCCTVHA